VLYHWSAPSAQAQLLFPTTMCPVYVLQSPWVYRTSLPSTKPWLTGQGAQCKVHAWKTVSAP
jgi:hypothetical protein